MDSSPVQSQGRFNLLKLHSQDNFYIFWLQFFTVRITFNMLLKQNVQIKTHLFRGGFWITDSPTHALRATWHGQESLLSSQLSRYNSSFKKLRSAVITLPRIPIYNNRIMARRSAAVYPDRCCCTRAASRRCSIGYWVRPSSPRS